ncbi:MAG: S1 RNA-binding domain-containing protein [Clostridia bacterium]|jgi:S1 RNA binding domain protein|nr:S1 RNA-binding domain-containing protein [Clostridia bacterium]
MKYQLNEIVQGTVTAIKNFGAFVELPDGSIGLVHISEVSDDYVKNISHYLSVGQKVKVMIIGYKDSKISLSIKQANPEDKLEKVSGGANQNFERMMKNYLRNTSDVMRDLEKRADRY